MMNIGRFQVFVHTFDSFRLDGGAMFGSVPKNLWSQKIQPDEENCIALVTRSLLIRDAERLFLVDVGMGDKWNEKSTKIFAIAHRDTPVSFRLQDVTDVVLTHLHFDHAGGVSRFTNPGSQELELNFPRAIHYLQRANFENALHPTLKERASYLKENVEILKRAQLKLLETSGEIHPGIFVHRVDGHTVGQQWIEVCDGGSKVFFPTDLIPTAHHIPLAFHMGYDMCAATVIEEKRALLTRAVEENAVLVFEHDSETAACKVALDSRGQFCRAEPVSL